MNKILNINLGGYPVSIDDDAYEYLSSYLNSLRRKFNESEGRDEIVNDIEARLGELITESMGSRKIVMLPDVEAAVNVLGKPEDFDDTAADEGQRQGPDPQRKSSNSGPFDPPKKGPLLKTGKRLFRDEQDSVVGGVASGLSAYLGIQDPLWVRLIFVVIGLGSLGFWIFVYLLLMAIIPKAETAADRLAMRGEPINVDNIAKEVEDRFNELSQKVNEIGRDKKEHTAGYHAMNRGVSAIGQTFGFALKFIFKFGGLILLAIFVCMLIGLAFASIGAIWGIFTGAPFIHFFSPFSSGVTWLGVFNVILLVGIPLLVACIFFTRKLFKLRAPIWLFAGLAGFWFLNLVSAGILGGIAFKSNINKGTLTTNMDISPSNDTLRVEMLNQFGDESSNSWIWNEEGLKLNENIAHINGNVSILVQRSKSGRFECSQVVQARGASTQKALENAEKISFEPVLIGNVFRVPTGITLEQGKKWHDQEVRLIIGVPEGKYITFDKDIYHYAAAELSEYAKGSKGNHISKRPEKIFKMTASGLLCTDCDNLNLSDLDSDKAYDNFVIDGDFPVEIIDSEDFSVEIIGSDKNKFELISAERDLTITSNGKAIGDGTKVIIKAPVFTNLIAEKGSKVVIRGFDEGRASITLRDAASAKVYMDVNELRISMSDNSVMDISGDGESLEVNTSETASLDAASFRADEIDVSASDASKVRVYARRNAVVKSTQESSVKVDGQGEVTKK